MNQKTQVLSHIIEKGSITALEAYNYYGILRLSARVYELRQDGHNIVTTNVEVRNRFGETVHVAKYTISPQDIDKRRCEVCGRILTSKASIKRGAGYMCAKHIEK